MAIENYIHTASIIVILGTEDGQENSWNTSLFLALHEARHVVKRSVFGYQVKGPGSLATKFYLTATLEVCFIYAGTSAKFTILFSVSQSINFGNDIFQFLR